MKMKVLLIRPGEEPELGFLNGSAEIRSYIGGCIETVPCFGYTIVCNDSFMLDDSLLYNVTLNGINYFGNIYICKVGIVNGEHDLVGLEDSDLESSRFIDLFMHCRRAVFF